MEDGKFNDVFTNHLVHWTGGTRLFRAFKECTGHCLDAVDKYPATSDQQREKISEILCEEQSTEVREVPNQRMWKLKLLMSVKSFQVS